MTITLQRYEWKKGDLVLPPRLRDASPRSLYIRRDVINAAEIIKWAKAQGFTSTLAASDMHVTVIYSRTAIDWMKISSDWMSSQEDGSLTIRPGGARLVERLGPEAVVLLFNSSELSWRHEAIKHNGASSDYEDYQPHVTITYKPPEGLDLMKVEPYRGEIRLGPEIFEEIDDTYRSNLEES